ncbi:SDR family oxidoreductase [Bradyrhizobium sp. CCBAU 51753]|uniref:SDR family oxidoreductase n=1 Tax=Bradyrhizobium sp. CCBAU 51753 TaxID=1325100 RepID=UPI00188B2D86|nr:SDR family oxidoreductase [Bradyrhizobium sp. CCBAU 51753]QOZ23893.1 short-chain dehydrogenase [Bradyrhizobium sp. CCBAU 51753]
MTQILITGANRGIGLALTSQYAGEGADVIACCRNPAIARSLKELASASAGRVQIMELDVADEASIASLKKCLGDRPIDIFINNAGIVGPEEQSADRIDAVGWMATLRVNALAPILLALALRENLKRGRDKKLVAISSGLGSTGREPRSLLNPIRYAYCASKAALNNGMHALSRDWAADGVLVAILAPGYVRTDMGGSEAAAHPNSISPEESAAGLIRRIAELTPTTSGIFQDYRGETIAW